MNIFDIKRFAADLFYPNRCPCCNKFIKWNETVCADCIKKMIPIKGNICPVCGKEIKRCICSLGLWYDRCLTVTTYTGVAKSGIYSLKDSCGKNFALWAAKILSQKILSDSDIMESDVIVPVPMRRKKQSQRGYNQAELIAKYINFYTGIPIDTGYLKKNTKIKDVTQHELGAKDRFNNAERMYISTGKKLSGRKVILCDDVITTGSTANKCSKILKENGASFVTVATAATTIME